MMASPGPTKSQAARTSLDVFTSPATRAPLPQHLAALLQDAVHPLVEIGQGGVDGRPATNGGLQALPDLNADLLPLRHPGSRHHPFELRAEGGGLGIAGQGGSAPGARPGRQVAGERVEPDLDRRLGEELDELPGLGRMAGTAEKGQAGAAGEGDSRPVMGIVRRRHGGRIPLVLHLGGQPAAELADVPRAGDVKGEVASGELLIDAVDLAVGPRRSEAAAEETDVEAGGLAKGGRAEIAVAVAIAQQTGAELASK